jgi:hypothetical protein
MNKQLFQLDNEQIEQLFFADCIVIGIVAPIKDYRFAWLINAITNLDFRKTLEQEFEFVKKTRKYRFSIYECLDEVLEQQHTIYCNQNDGEYLIPELRNFDFIWLIKNIAEKQIAPQQIVAAINSLDEVQVCSIINLDNIKSRNRLIL